MTQDTRYEVSGNVRGLISKHYTLREAIKSKERDHRQCAALGGGAYSDATIHHTDGTTVSDEEWIAEYGAFLPADEWNDL